MSPLDLRRIRPVGAHVAVAMMRSRRCGRQGQMSQKVAVEKSWPGLQGAAQTLYDLPDRFLVASIPAPLSLLGRLHQSSLREDRHVMGDGGLGEVYPLLNVSRTKARGGAGLCR